MSNESDGSQSTDQQKQPEPQSQKKKRGCLKWIIAIIMIIVVVRLCSGGPSAEELMKSAEVSASKGDISEALAFAEKACRRDPSSSNLRDYISYAWDAKRFDIVGPKVEKYVQTTQSSPESLWIRAKYYTITGQSKLALRDLNSAISKDRNHVEARVAIP